MTSASPPSRSRYEARIRRVLDHIHANLDAPPDLNRLAEIACLSPYHWHRVYRELQGETIHATVSRLRLQRAAGELSGGSLELRQIARHAGYSAVPPFARAFKAAYGIAPGRYRSDGPHAHYRDDALASGASSFEVEVLEMSGLNCLAVAHTGRYLDVDRAFSTLFRRLAAAGIDADAVRTLGVYFDEPALVDEHRLESLACATDVPAGLEIDGLDAWRVPSGLHAVLHHRGPYDTLDDAYRWLFGRWLPASGHEPDDHPVHEHYLDDPRVTPPMELRVDIHLPLAAAPV